MIISVPTVTHRHECRAGPTPAAVARRVQQGRTITN